jgi:hypothetical protein
MVVTNTLAYYDAGTFTAILCFIVQSPGVQLKHFEHVHSNCCMLMRIKCEKLQEI